MFVLIFFSSHLNAHTSFKYQTLFDVNVSHSRLASDIKKKAKASSPNTSNANIN